MLVNDKLFDQHSVNLVILRGLILKSLYTFDTLLVLPNY